MRNLLNAVTVCLLLIVLTPGLEAQTLKNLLTFDDSGFGYTEDSSMLASDYGTTSTLVFATPDYATSYTITIDNDGAFDVGGIVWPNPVPPGFEWGDVFGPSSSTDNNVVRFDGTTGKLIQGSGISVSDTGVVTSSVGALEIVPNIETNQITNNLTVFTERLIARDVNDPLEPGVELQDGNIVADGNYTSTNGDITLTNGNISTTGGYVSTDEEYRFNQSGTPTLSYQTAATPPSTIGFNFDDSLNVQGSLSLGTGIDGGLKINDTPTNFVTEIESTVTGSPTKIPTSAAVNTGLGTKLNLSGGTLTGTLTTRDISIGSTYEITQSGTSTNVFGGNIQSPTFTSSGIFTARSGSGQRNLLIYGGGTSTNSAIFTLQQSSSLTNGGFIQIVKGGTYNGTAYGANAEQALLAFSSTTGSGEFQISTGTPGSGATGRDIRIDPAGGNLWVEGNVRVVGGQYFDDGVALTVPDYVFDYYLGDKSTAPKGYEQLSIRDLKNFVLENRHLPRVPADGSAEWEALSLSDRDMLNLEKIEELNLHNFQQQETIEKLQDSLTNVWAFTLFLFVMLAVNMILTAMRLEIGR